MSTDAAAGYLVKRRSSFDYAQDGEPVEPYLANKDADAFIPSCASRFTRYERRRTGQRIAIAAEMLKNYADYGSFSRRILFSPRSQI